LAIGLSVLLRFTDSDYLPLLFSNFSHCTYFVVNNVTIALIEVLLKEESNYRSDMTHGNKTDKQKHKVNKGIQVLSIWKMFGFIIFEDRALQPNI
jgi:hypothetical protein